MDVPAYNEGVQPAHAHRLVYREGNSCPVCGRAVETFRRHLGGRPAAGDPEQLVLSGGAGGAATLMPCGHRVDAVYPPGTGPQIGA